MNLIIKHAPKCFKDLVFETTAQRSHFEDYATGRRGGSPLLFGDYGTGKSTLARIIQQELHDLAQTGNGPACLQASLMQSDLEAQITGQWNMERSQGILYPRVVIDEVDQLSVKQQLELRGVMDKYPDFGFIFTTNKLGKVDGGIRDRCDKVEIRMPAPDAWIKTVTKVLDAEGVTVSYGQALRLATAGKQSIRQLGRVLDEAVARSLQIKVPQASGLVVNVSAPAPTPSDPIM